MQPEPSSSIDYLIIGHVTRDLLDGTAVLGGTASYASLTAQAFGLHTAVATSASDDVDLLPLSGIAIHRHAASKTTTFENLETHQGRRQVIRAIADPLDLESILEDWRSARILHLGPIAGEVDATILDAFPHAFRGITLQGWLRSWDAQGHVSFRNWPDASRWLPVCDAAVMSIEDVQGDEALIQSFAQLVNVLAVTEGEAGARIYWHGDVRRITAPLVDFVDATGAGDIFAAAFFIRLQESRDAWEAGNLAVQLASRSVTRRGMQGIPTAQEIANFKVEIIKGPSLR
jgi:sugar/nucleoside kinase (ribokinase family)